MSKKIRAELLRVQAGKAEMEYQIELKQEEIQRLEANMAKQEAAEIELINKLKESENK